MNVKVVATDLIEKYHTNSPFEIADYLEIQIINCPLKSTLGYYNKYLRVQTIILNSTVPEALRNFVCAHELCHAICHANTNTEKLRKYTFLSVDRIEREANTFAIELLLPDNLLHEYAEYSIHTIANMVGVPAHLVGLKKAPSKL